jgi:GMP synthase-like glutamine amidotransferase
MRTLIFQHSTETDAGTTLEWLRQRQWPVTTLLLPASPLPIHLNPEDFDLLVICGGGMNVDQEEQYPWLRAEKKWIWEFLQISKSKKILGLCLGAQLIAEVLGAKVGKSLEWEAGWQKVHWFGDQETESPHSSLSKEKLLRVFQFHGYSFSLPAGAINLASSECCQNQAYKIGEQVLAFQFHPETTVDWALACAAETDGPSPSQYVQSPSEIERDNQYQPALQKWYFSQLDTWLINRS